MTPTGRPEMLISVVASGLLFAATVALVCSSPPLRKRLGRTHSADRSCDLRRRQSGRIAGSMTT